MIHILDLEKQAEELSSQVCSFSKPLVLSPEYKEEIHQLLSSESDLRLSIEYAMEVETKAEAQDKLSLAKEEAEIILYTLIKLKKTNLKEVNKIIEIAKSVIETIDKIK